MHIGIVLHIVTSLRTHLLKKGKGSRYELMGPPSWCDEPLISQDFKWVDGITNLKWDRQLKTKRCLLICGYVWDSQLSQLYSLLMSFAQSKYGGICTSAGGRRKAAQRWQGSLA